MEIEISDERIPDIEQIYEVEVSAPAAREHEYFRLLRNENRADSSLSDYGLEITLEKPISKYLFTSSSVVFAVNAKIGVFLLNSEKSIDFNISSSPVKLGM